MGKVLVVTDGYGLHTYHRPFKKFGDATDDSDLLWTNPKEIKLVVFTGGADVSPCLYGQEAAKMTSCVPRRDIYESISFQKALSLRKPMVGICRGAQFLNIMAGGKLVQHLDNHGCYHDMTTVDSRTFEVSSTHHQMMLPPEGALLVGWATHKRSKHYYGADDKPLNPPPKFETEVVYWPKLRAVGMQYHPECMGEYTRGFTFASELVERYLLR